MNQKGFSLLELLLSIAIIGILAGFSLPLYASTVQRNEIFQTTKSVASTLRRASLYSRANNGDSQWGVNFASGQVTLFKGPSFVARDANFDEPLSINQGINISYIGDIVFSKLHSLPSAQPIIDLTNNQNDTKSIQVNSKGRVIF